MTQDEIIEMARQAGINYRELSDEFATGNGDGVEIEQMQAFAALVAAAEREACAKVCEDYGRAEEMQAIGNDYAEAIRARGQA